MTGFQEPRSLRILIRGLKASIQFTRRPGLAGLRPLSFGIIVSKSFLLGQPREIHNSTSDRRQRVVPADNRNGAGSFPAASQRQMVAGDVLKRWARAFASKSSGPGSAGGFRGKVLVRIGLALLSVRFVEPLLNCRKQIERNKSVQTGAGDFRSKPIYNSSDLPGGDTVSASEVPDGDVSCGWHLYFRICWNASYITRRILRSA